MARDNQGNVCHIKTRRSIDKLFKIVEDCVSLTKNAIEIITENKLTLNNIASLTKANTSKIDYLYDHFTFNNQFNSKLDMLWNGAIAN